MNPLDLLNTLKKHGYTSYLVGGYTRDFLLNKETYDIDITTPATPEEVLKIFGLDVPINYGCVSFKKSSYDIEITTFRKETYDKDRHPSIEYTNSVLEDLKRRDFTINAILMDSEGNIIDPLEGRRDLENKIVRVVGDIEEKFFEDPLRILRAVRFASTYNFKIEEKAEEFILRNPFLLKNISKESIMQELDKMFSIKPIESIILLKNLGLLDVLDLKVKETLVEASLEGVWANLEGFSSYPFKRSVKKDITEISKILEENKIDEYTFLNYKYENILTAGTILGIPTKTLEKIYENMEIKSIKDLDITSDEIINLVGKKGSIIKEIKSCLIKEILSGNLSNEKSILKKYIIKKWK